MFHVCVSEVSSRLCSVMLGFVWIVLYGLVLLYIEQNDGSIVG